MRAVPMAWMAVLLVLSACDGWPSGPDTYGAGTTLPTRTPRIQTPTPIVLSPTPLILTPETFTASPQLLSPSPLPPSETPTLEITPTPNSLRIDILGCDTGIDVLHGMGEVTNAYMTISNPTGADFTNVCATLRGLDEGRIHPDKTKCLAAFPTGYQVTLKLTVDTTYQAATPIQVDVTSGDQLLARLGKPACEAIGILLPGAGELGVLKPIP